jgi:hypothetical protein
MTHPEFITYDIVNEDAPGMFSADASELELSAGLWPEQLATTMGNGLALVRHCVDIRDGELLSVEYRQASGSIRLRVYND